MDFGIFRRRWKHSHWQQKYEVLAKLTDKAKLAYIARNDDNWDIRCKAVSKLTNRTKLAYIADNDANYMVRHKATDRLYSLPPPLKTRLLNILRPKWQHSDRDVRKQAVSRLTDEVKLAQIARRDSEYSVVETAVKKITNVGKLEVLSISNIRWANKLASERLSQLRQADVEKLEDQTLLTQIAKTDTDLSVQVAAVRRISDRTILKEIMKTGQYSTALAAANKLAEMHLSSLDFSSPGDVKLLATVYMSEALEDLTDPALIKWLITRTSDAKVRAAAVSSLIKLEKVDALKELLDLLNTFNEWGAQQVVQIIEDPSLVVRLLLQTNLPWQKREAAKKRLEVLGWKPKSEEEITAVNELSRIEAKNTYPPPLIHSSSVEKNDEYWKRHPGPWPGKSYG